MSVALRLASPGDERALASLHAATVAVAYADIFPADSDPPTVDDLAPGYRTLLAGPGATVLVAERDNATLADRAGALVGSIVLVEDLQVPAGRRIERFNVHPDAQGQGAGGRLYRAALDRARTLGAERLNLWVLRENTRARSIYEGWGWTLVPGWTMPNDPPEVEDVLYELDVSDQR